MTYTQLITQHLATCDLSRARRINVARTFGINVKALSHALEREGRTYTDLIMAERKRRCLAMVMRDPEVKGSHVAIAVGYVSAESLYQEFPKWFGQNWRQFKKAHALEFMSA